MSCCPPSLARISSLSTPPTTKSSRGEKGAPMKRAFCKNEVSERSTSSVPPQMIQRCGSRSNQSGKRESGLAEVRRYRLQNDVGPRRELLELCLLGFHCSQSKWPRGPLPSVRCASARGAAKTRSAAMIRQRITHGTRSRAVRRKRFATDATRKAARLAHHAGCSRNLRSAAGVRLGNQEHRRGCAKEIGLQNRRRFSTK